MTTSENFFGWTVGTRVATRRGKIGTIVAVQSDTVTVRFGPTFEVEMKNGQLIRETEYRGMMRGKPVPYQNR